MKQYIRKYILVSAILAIGGTVASAQTTTTETKHESYTNKVDVNYYNTYRQGFWNNWAIEAMGGARMLFAEEDNNLDFGKRITAGMLIGLTKAISPDISIRGTFGYGTLKGWNTGVAGIYKNVAEWSYIDPVRTYLEGQGINCANGYEQTLKHFTIGVDFMVNLWNVCTSNNDINRKWNPYLFFGPEYFQILEYKGYDRTYKIGLHAGLKLDVALTKHLALTGEVSGSSHSATFDNEIGKGHRNDFYLSAMLGLKIHLGKAQYIQQCVIPAEEYDKLQNTVTYIKEKYNATGSKVRMPNGLLAPSVVFDDDKATYSEELQNVNLSQIAEWLKENPKMNVSVIGNNHIVSDELAKERAEIVRQKLMDMYGIDGSRLVVITRDINAEYMVAGNNQAVNFGVAK